MNQSLRILLWDLDGTLVRGQRFGTFKDYTVPMLQSVFGTAGCLPELVVSGMTDLQIIEEALRPEGITREHISSRKSELKEPNNLATVLREKRRDDERENENEERAEPTDAPNVRLVARTNGCSAGEQIE